MNAQDLKNSIFQLAVQGKLVEQRVEEGTAKELLEQIKAEKEKLIKEKKIKKEKPLPEIAEDEIPFEIPESWEWVRLAELGEIIGGGTPKTANIEFWDGDIAWLTPADMKNIKGKYASRGERNITELGLDKSSARLMPKGTVLYSSRAPIGYIAIADNDISTNQGFKSLVPIDTGISEYIYYCLIARTGNIVSRASGTTFKEISGAEFGMTVVPVPPIEEQKRIVAKIEEILPYIDQYDKAYTKLETFNKKFPEDMKKSILQLAMQGKLVEQRPEEGTADELYKQIIAEKAHLIKDGKIKKEKPLPGITEDEIPFEIPSSWKWVRLADIVTLQNGDRSNKYPVESDYVEEGIPFFGAKDMGIKYMSFDSVRFISQNKFDELRTGKLCDKDFVCLLRGSVGKVAIFSENEHHKTGFICAQMIILRSLIREVVDYLYSVFSSPYYYRCIELKTTGTAVRQLPAKELGNILIPLPPLAEQKRIIAKIEELLPYCDQLVK